MKTEKTLDSVISASLQPEQLISRIYVDQYKSDGKPECAEKIWKGMRAQLSILIKSAGNLADEHAADILRPLEDLHGHIKLLPHCEASANEFLFGIGNNLVHDNTDTKHSICEAIDPSNASSRIPYDRVFVIEARSWPFSVEYDYRNIEISLYEISEKLEEIIGEAGDDS